MLSRTRKNKQYSMTLRSSNEGNLGTRLSQRLARLSLPGTLTWGLMECGSKGRMEKQLLGRVSYQITQKIITVVAESAPYIWVRDWKLRRRDSRTWRNHSGL